MHKHHLLLIWWPLDSIACMFHLQREDGKQHYHRCSVYSIDSASVLTLLVVIGQFNPIRAIWVTTAWNPQNSDNLVDGEWVYIDRIKSVAERRAETTFRTHRN
jgi:hypothetical protein